MFTACKCPAYQGDSVGQNRFSPCVIFGDQSEMNLQGPLLKMGAGEALLMVHRSRALEAGSGPCPPACALPEPHCYPVCGGQGRETCP